MADELSAADLDGQVLTVEQDIPLRDRRSQDPQATAGVVRVTALPTGVEGLVICPTVSTDSDDALAFGPHCTLTHTHTGRSIMRGESPALRRLATELADIDWSFTDVAHFTDPANADTLERLQSIVRAWQTVDDPWNDRPIRLFGDTDEDMPAQRAAAPAQTMLREQIEQWLKASERQPSFPDKDDTQAQRAFYDHVAISVYEYGLIYLLAVLDRAAPVVAAVAARNLYADFDGGELGEWVYQWGQELTAGQPLTLYGIPAAEPLVAEAHGGLPLSPDRRDPEVRLDSSEPTVLPRPGSNFVDLDGRTRGVTAVTSIPNSVYDTCYRVDYLDGDPELYGVVGTRHLR